MYPRKSSDWGGVFVQEQVSALRALGVDVRVATGDAVRIWRNPQRAPGLLLHFVREALGTKDQRVSPPWQIRGGVPVLYFPYLAPPGRWWGMLAARSYRASLLLWGRAIRREFRFQVVHAHTAFLDGSAALAMSRAYGVPVVLTEHTGPFSTLTKGRVMRKRTQDAINRADLVIAVSERLKADILREINVSKPGQIIVMGNGFDPAIFYPSPGPRVEDGTIRALWVGGFDPVKQPIMLIDAFARAARENERLRLTMAGHGSLASAVRDRVARLGLSGKVTLLSSRTRTEVADLMREHHFLVISSKIETFGLVAVEAMGCGRPVLTTKCGGPEETVKDESRGELVQDSLSALAGGFLRLAKRLAQFDSEALASYARAHYSLNTIAGQLQSQYAQLSTNRP
jgi:glycosyltransferase involved in cell wall biosynthesis